MNPSVQDRLDSCVRALEHVILPALPENASLAREQTMLVMGQVQIIRAQLDATPSFEEQESIDLANLAKEICAVAGEQGLELRKALDNSASDVPHERTAAIQEAIDQFLQSYEGKIGVPSAIVDIICGHGARRAQKDREWFSAMGFDAGVVVGAGR